MNTNNCIKEINKVFLQEIITVEITKYDETNSKYLSYLFYTKDFAEHEYKKILERINK